MAEFKKLRTIATYDCLLKEWQVDPIWGKADEGPWLPRLGEVLLASIEVLDISQCEPDILNQVRELLEQRQQGERSNFLLLKKIIIEFVAKANSAVALEQAREQLRSG